MSEKKNPPKAGEISITKDVEKTIVTAIEKVGEGGQKQPYILFLSGPLIGKIHMLEEGTTSMGRGTDVTLPVNDNRVSRKHIEMIIAGDHVVLQDLGSTNGTFVNGKKVDQHVLADGDKIQISSNTIFKFALQDRTENVFHKELYKMAVVDAVTGIYNKRYFIERIKEELSHARRGKKALSLLMIDIDFFKQVNDTHGHLAGDMILQQVAQKLKGVVRAEDILARYGGEEFAILLRETTEANACLLAERMRILVADSSFAFEERPIPVTISIGIATHSDQTSFETCDALITASDECLYFSKEHGRNRIKSKSQPS